MVSFTPKYVGLIGGWMRAHFSNQRPVNEPTLIPRYATLYCTLRYVKLHYITLLRLPNITLHWLALIISCYYTVTKTRWNSTQKHAIYYFFQLHFLPHIFFCEFLYTRHELCLHSVISSWQPTWMFTNFLEFNSQKFLLRFVIFTLTSYLQ